MSEQTLWKLAQSWRRQAEEILRGDSSGHPQQALELNACAFQLEKLLREKAKEVREDRDRAAAIHEPIQQDCYEEFLEWIGVPEEQ